jgi:hypothetical protein
VQISFHINYISFRCPVYLLHPPSVYKSRNKTPNEKIIKSLLNGGISFAFCIHAVVKHRFFGNAVEMLLRRKGFTGHIVLNIFLLKKIVMRSLL